MKISSRVGGALSYSLANAMAEVTNDFGSKDQNLPKEDVPIAVTNLIGNCPLQPRVPPLLSSTIHIWQFPLTVSEPEFAAFGELLSSDERDRASRFHFQRDSRRFSLGRASVRAILAGYTLVPAREIGFVYSEHRKPALADPKTNIQFSISHSGNLALVAVALGRQVGSDIEAVRADIEIEKLAARFFSSREYHDLLALPQEQRIAAFFRYWTCKEAFLKAQGVGLSRGLGSFDVGLKPRAHLAATRPDPGEADLWSLYEVEAPTGYASAVAVEGVVSAIQLFRYGAGA